MFKKIKIKLKNKLIDFLELGQFKSHYRNYIEENNKDKFLVVNDIRECECLINNNKEQIKEKWKATECTLNKLSKEFKNTYQEQQEQINIISRTLQSVISVGADVDSRPLAVSHSWAVICIEGRYNVIKFIDLHGKDYRYIIDFLKQFECSRKVIDAPYKEMFLENFKF